MDRNEKIVIAATAAIVAGSAAVFAIRGRLSKKNRNEETVSAITNPIIVNIEDCIPA